MSVYITNKILHNKDLKSTDKIVLSLITNYVTINISDKEIGIKLYIPRSTVSRYITKLKKLNLITEERDKYNRRKLISNIDNVVTNGLIIPDSIISDTYLSSNQKILLSLILNYSNMEKLVCTTTNRKFGEIIGMNETNASKLVSSLNKYFDSNECFDDKPLTTRREINVDTLKEIVQLSKTTRVTLKNDKGNSQKRQTNKHYNKQTIKQVTKDSTSSHPSDNASHPPFSKEREESAAAQLSNKEREELLKFLNSKFNDKIINYINKLNDLYDQPDHILLNRWKSYFRKWNKTAINNAVLEFFKELDSGKFVYSNSVGVFKYFDKKLLIESRKILTNKKSNKKSNKKVEVKYNVEWVKPKKGVKMYDEYGKEGSPLSEAHNYNYNCSVNGCKGEFDRWIEDCPVCGNMIDWDSI